VPYFHCAGISLAPGSIILRGNFGRIIRAAGPSHNFYWRETALEERRLRLGSPAPSRLKCAFAVPTVEVARNFMQAGRGLDVLYEVEAVDQSIEPFVADFNLVNDVERFWTSVPETHPTAEVLLDADLRILRRIAPGGET
jgi:hypothetical protein